jgi:tetratricopeptide (TPR) repeat protein
MMLLLAVACATPTRTRSPADVRWQQADEPFPSSAVFADLSARAAFNEGRFREAEAAAANRGGDAKRGREQLATAAQAYLDFLAQYPDTGWDLKIRYHAARLLSLAGRHEEAAALADQVATDSHAGPKSRAMALLLATNALVDAEKLEPMRMRYASQRDGRPPRPVSLPKRWNEFVQATDAYLAGMSADGTEPDGRIVTAAQLAVVAAQAEFATDHMDAARRRLATILKRWPSEPEVFQSAARPYVETFLVPGDPDGALAAATWVGALASEQARVASGPEDRQRYENVAKDIRAIEVDLRFDAAKELLPQDPGEAAQRFEALASIPGADAAAALNAAAIAWDRAGDADRAASLRARILERHADSWLAPDATLQLAAHLARRGDHLEAGRTYREHARRWPEDANHCTALRNGAVELDLGDHDRDSADLYRAFGADRRCAAKSPNVAAIALHLAGKQFLAANRPDDARDAFRRAVAVQGITSADARRRVAESKRLLRRLGTH